mmetsp:Transcript_71663/g.181004  ORF Transcript_71663/g.181004 Transcript_71663/m.181004 type:complete len:409 (-) Transcript_71663:234-1460(-)
MLLLRSGARLPSRRAAPQLLANRCLVSGATDANAAASPGEGPRAALLDGPTLADFMPAGGGGCGVGSAAVAGVSRPPAVRKPPWLKMFNPNTNPETAERYKFVRSTIKKTGLATVCEEARCPNAGECWSSGTATVMIMGDTCTRGCRFCAVSTSRTPPALNPEEPKNIAEAVEQWDVDYIVLTMVDRDDLADQGCAHVAETVRNLKQRNPNLRVETLVGDWQGRLDLVEQLVDCGMDVYAHNIETVERLQRIVRDRRAGYQQSLSVLRHAKTSKPGIVTKSSIMVGLGETAEELHQVLRDLRDHGVDIVTFGQYLQPTKSHMKVDRYMEPSEFDEWKRVAEALGFHCASGPLVRSSYRAGDLFKSRLASRAAGESSARPIEAKADAWASSGVAVDMSSGTVAQSQVAH